MPDRRTILAGNWKMHLDLEGAQALARDIASGLGEGVRGEVVLFPPAPFLGQVVAAVANSAHPIGVGSQNIHNEPKGAFTGEISTSMVLSTGARWTLIGHSERRHVFGETDEMINRKVHSALEAGLSPILCVGETLDERESGRTEDVVLGQLRAGLAGLDAGAISRMVIAYEPVWAIGTGRTATPQQGGEVHRAVRKELESLASAAVAGGMRILYGGSVNPGNVKDLLKEPDIDGVLVGGASLDAAKFLPICHAESGS